MNKSDRKRMIAINGVVDCLKMYRYEYHNFQKGKPFWFKSSDKRWGDDFEGLTYADIYEIYDEIKHAIESRGIVRVGGFLGGVDNYVGGISLAVTYGSSEWCMCVHLQDIDKRHGHMHRCSHCNGIDALANAKVHRKFFRKTKYGPYPKYRGGQILPHRSREEIAMNSYEHLGYVVK
jgi:hypothetical protein